MRYGRLILSFGLSLVFLYLTFFIPRIGALLGEGMGVVDALFGHARFDLSQLSHVVVSANWGPIALAGVIFLGSLLVRAWRWSLMLNPLVKMSYAHVFGAMSIGYMANNVLPLRMGEVYRAQVVYQLSGLSRSAAFGSVVLERVVDLIFLVPYVILALIVVPLPGAIKQAAYVAAALAGGVLVFILWLVLDRTRAIRMARAALGRFSDRIGNSAVGLLEKFTSGLSVLRRTDIFLELALSSLLLWATYAGMIYLVLRALGFMEAGIPIIDENPLGAILAALLITTVGFTMPGAPGAVGTYHGMSVLGLSLLGVPGDRAAGFAIVLHALNYIPLTVIGLIFFWKYGLTFHGSRPLPEDCDASQRV